VIRLALFDDSIDRQASIRLLLENEPDIFFCGEFINGVDAVNNVAKCKPDVVLMDIEMPNVNGIKATSMLRKVYPKLPILIQTIYEDDDNLFKSLQAGATGYILKKASPEKIIEAIKDANQGGAPITPAMAFKVLKFFQTAKHSSSTNYGLSNREKHILRLLVDGFSYKMIAVEESISYHTVNSHVQNIYTKLHVHSVGEAVSKALKEDLINQGNNLS